MTPAASVPGQPPSGWICSRCRMCSFLPYHSSGSPPCSIIIRAAGHYSYFIVFFRPLQVPSLPRFTGSYKNVPSLNKGKHACQRVFPALFALFALACASKPASQKPKITRKSIAGRCEAVLPEQKCVQTRKDPQRILAVLSRGLTQYGRISARQNRFCPCQAMVKNQLVYTKNNRRATGCNLFHTGFCTFSTPFSTSVM